MRVSSANRRISFRIRKSWRQRIQVVAIDPQRRTERAMNQVVVTSRRPIGQKTISFAPDSDNPIGGFAQLFPKPPDMGIHGPSIDHVLVAPDILQESLTGKGTASTFQ